MFEPRTVPELSVEEKVTKITTLMEVLAKAREFQDLKTAKVIRRSLRSLGFFSNTRGYREPKFTLTYCREAEAVRFIPRSLRLARKNS